MDDTNSTPAAIDQISFENACSESSCTPDNNSGVTKQVDQGMALENAREPVESKSGADDPDPTFADGA